MKTTKIEVKQTVKSSQALAIIEDLLKSLNDGKICVEKGDEFISLEPAGDIVIKLKAEQKKAKAEFNLSLSWRETAGDMEQSDAFKISSVEPAPPIVDDPLADDGGQD